MGAEKWVGKQVRITFPLCYLAQTWPPQAAFLSSHRAGKDRQTVDLFSAHVGKPGGGPST